MGERRQFKEVQEILDIGKEVYAEHSRIWADDLLGAAKLYSEISSEVPQIWNDIKLRNRFIRGLIEWSIFEKGHTFGRLYNRVLDYLSVFEVNEYSERYIKEFMVAYSEYCGKRWGKKIILDNQVTEAAKIAKRLVKEFGITVLEYIRRQHECWDKITQPLTMKALIDENKCRKRNEICIEVEKKKGIIKREDYKIGMVSRKWSEILTIGVSSFLEKTTKHGYLTYVARMYMEDKKRGISDVLLKKRYSPEQVEKNWEKLEGEIEL